jgi:alpha-1,3-rhamnosyl/mannosyltransferase
LSKVKLILGVNSITYPLNGMGRYALELAKGLLNSGEIADIRFFYHGKFIRGDEPAAIAEGTSGNAAAFGWRMFSALKRGLRDSPAAAWGYARVLPLIERSRLRAYPDYIFHGTSYLLPDHAGPAVTTIYDLSTFRHPEWHPAYRVRRLNLAIKRTLDRASRIITISETVRQEIINYFNVPGEKVTAIPLGVDACFRRRGNAETASLLASLGLTHGAYTLCVSTIEPRKNICRLVEAFCSLPAALRQAYPLVLAGDYGWKCEDAHRLISAAEQTGTVKYLGHVPEQALPALYSGCRAFLYPSLYEGFGLPILEAMAGGAPVLTSDCSCMPEVAGGAALLVNPRDVRAVARGIERTLTDEMWRAEAVERGLIRARSMTWDSTVMKTMEVYKKVWAGNAILN